MTSGHPPAIESVEEFARVAKIGLGRAILHLRDHDPAPYRDAIVNACLHYTAYDWQIEGMRTQYLCDLMDATGQWRTFVAPILTALRETTDFRDADQLVRLAARFAENDYVDARAAVYETFADNDRWERFGSNSYREPFLGYGSIIALDGLDGLVYVADQMGAALLADPPLLDDGDRWLLSSAQSNAEEDLGEEAVRAALERAGADNPRIVTFVAAVTAERTSHSGPPVYRPPWRGATYAEIRAGIEEPDPIRDSLMGLGNWGRDASDADIALAAADVLAEIDRLPAELAGGLPDDANREDVPEHVLLRRLLSIFRKRTFPLQIDGLLKLARHPNKRLILEATNALSMVASPEVRALALALIADENVTGWRRSRAVGLLRSNYEPGDERLLARLLDSPRDEDEFHSLGFAALDVLKQDLSPDAVPALLALYHHGPCTVCRGKILGLLRDLGAVPPWLLEECRYDASSSVRELAEEIAGGEAPDSD